MSLPPEFKDIDERIDSIFESGDAYRETTDISVPETLPPEMTDEQAEEWMEPIEDIGDDTQKYDFDPVEPFRIHDFDRDTANDMIDSAYQQHPNLK
jgi:hypothetical protein